MPQRTKPRRKCATGDKQVSHDDLDSPHGSPKYDLIDNISVRSSYSSASALEIARLKEEHAREVAALEEALDRSRLERGGGCVPSVRGIDERQSVGDKANAVSVNTEVGAIPQPLRVVGSIELPKVELFRFDGNPIHYWKFIRQFEYYVEARVNDDSQRMLYLLHYCCGRAKAAIEECIMLPPAMAYSRARGILARLFGQPFHVAHAMIDDMLQEARHVTGNADSLSRLSIRMENCSIALEQMNYSADLNALQTIERVVKCLLSLCSSNGLKRSIGLVCLVGSRLSMNCALSFLNGHGWRVTVLDSWRSEASRNRSSHQPIRGGSKQSDETKV